MSKNRSVQYPTELKNGEVAKIIAHIKGVSPRYVRMVINGERNNEDIFSAVMEYLEGKNRLIETIKNLIPLN